MIPRIVLALLFALGVFVTPLSQGPVEAGGGSLTPYVEWSNPSVITYGGWPVSTSAYIYNPTNNPVRFQARVWHNSAALDSRGFGIVQANWSTLDPTMMSSYCDKFGCAMDIFGNIPQNGRTYMVFGTYSGRILGDNMTVGSVTVTIDGTPGKLYAEGRASLVQGQRFEARLEQDTGFTPQGGHTFLRLKVTDRTLNDFQLLGVAVGTECLNAILPDITWWNQFKDVTWAQWTFAVYIPDNVQSCTVTVMVKTKETVFSINYTVKRQVNATG